MKILRTSGASLLVLVTACADDGSDGGGAGSPPSDAEVFTVRFEAVTVAPGEERTQCVVKRLDNAEPIHVGAIENELNSSHHLIVYKTNDTDEQPTPFDCQPFTSLLDPDRGVPLLISQKSMDRLDLPAGVGFALEPRQMIRLELHYLNSTQDPIEVSATSRLTRLSEAQVEHEAGFAIFANTAISLAPQSDATLGPLSMTLPAQLDGAKFFSFTGHEHRLGTGVTVAVTDAPEGPEVSVYAPEAFAWNEPPTVYHDPPVELPPGGGFSFSCAWSNTTSDTIGFGESANDEMCLFYSFYYPNKGAIACAYSDLVDGGSSFCCPGDSICDLLP